LLVLRGFDANLGARPLKRVIQRMVLDPLALKIVSGEVKPGEKVLVDASQGEIIVQAPLNVERLTKTKM